MTSDRAWEHRTWRWFLRMAVLEMVSLARVLNLEVLRFLPSKASSFLPIFAPFAYAVTLYNKRPPGVRTSIWLVA